MSSPSTSRRTDGMLSLRPDDSMEVRSRRSDVFAGCEGSRCSGREARAKQAFLSWRVVAEPLISVSAGTTNTKGGHVVRTLPGQDAMRDSDLRKEKQGQA